jgi:putative tricarboxylic transport membrane protein
MRPCVTFPAKAIVASLIMAAVALVLAGCGATSRDGDTAAEGDGTLTGVRVMVPNTAGGGYDTTARTAVKVMETAGIAKGVEVFNLPGAGGTVGLARLVNERGNGDLAMMMGLGVVGAAYTNKSESKLSDTTPIARLVEEAEAVVVSKDSPYTSLQQLVAAWKANPGKVTVGGGSSPGGPDHLFPMQLAQTVGIDPQAVNYVAYDGGGELLPALLGNKLGFATSGYSEFLDQIQAGQLRVLAVSSEQRVSAVDAPTLKESGVDLAFANWRGVVAPPGISDADKQALVSALDRMHTSDGWKEALTSRGWTDAYLSGEGFSTFLKEQDQRVADVLAKAGVA